MYFRRDQMKRLVWLVLTVFVGGCIVGPDHVPPCVCAPDNWHQELEKGRHTNVDELREWWWLFNDPLLGELIERAKANNLDLYTAFTRICQARAQVCIAESNLFPWVDGTAGYSRTRQSINGLGIAGIPGFIIDPFSIWSTGWTVSWECNLFGRVTRQIESADAGLGATIEFYRDVMVLLLSDVAATYVELRTLQEQLRYARQNVKIQTEALELAKRRVEGGIAPILDEYQATSNLAGTESAIPPIELAIHRTLNRLAVLIGEYPGTLHCQLAAPAPIPSVPPSLPITLPCDVIRQRPDIRLAEREMARATADLGVAVSDLFPQLSFNGSFQLQSRELSTLFAGDSWSHQFGPSFVWPVFQAGRIRCNIEGSEARVEETFAIYQQAVLLAVEEVENAVIGFEKETTRLEHLDETVKAAEESLRSVAELYRSGKTDFLNVLNSLQTLFTAQNEYAVTQGQIVLQLVDLYRALGGGWDPEHHCGTHCVRLRCSERCDAGLVEELTKDTTDVTGQYSTVPGENVDDPLRSDTDAPSQTPEAEGLERLPALENSNSPSPPPENLDFFDRSQSDRPPPGE